MHPPGPDTCIPTHDRTAFVLSALISAGLLVSYLPQHIRIIANKSSEGIDPTFLLLGATSSASSLLNILALEWAAVRCCRFVPGTSCLESLMGVIQIALQWACFNLVFILFLVYFPLKAKYVNWVASDPPKLKAPKWWRNVKKAFRPANFSGAEEYVSDSDDDEGAFDFQSASYAAIERHVTRSSQTTTSPEWRMSVNYAVITTLHLLICGFVTFLLLLTLPKASQPPVHPTPDPLPVPGEESRDARVVRFWATSLGITSTVLALFQYLPQIWRTWQRKLVGSLSIPMMCIQTPGSFVFVYSLIIRPGVNWTAWTVYLITGILQGLLLAICIAWSIRQKRLGIDAYGNPTGADARQEGNENSRLLR